MPRSTLHGAAGRGDIDTVYELLVEDEVDINDFDANGNTPLHWAALRGHLSVVDVLLEHGADVNIRDRMNRTPLDLAKLDEENRKIVKSLTRAIHRKLKEVKAVERSEGRYRSDQIEVRARGRYDRMARDEATRRAWVERNLAAHRLAVQDKRFRSLKLREQLALQEAQTQVELLETERRTLEAAERQRQRGGSYHGNIYSGAVAGSRPSPQQSGYNSFEPVGIDPHKLHRSYIHRGGHTDIYQRSVPRNKSSYHSNHLLPSNAVVHATVSPNAVRSTKTSTAMEHRTRIALPSLAQKREFMQSQRIRGRFTQSTNGSPLCEIDDENYSSRSAYEW